MTARVHEPGSGSVQGRRFAVAALALAAAIGLAVAPARLPGAQVPDGASVVPEPPPDGVGALLARLETLTGEGLAEPSAVFQSEIGLPAQCRDVRADEAARVVGFVVDADVASARCQFDRQVESRGFTRVDLVGVEGSTFVKGEGAVTWALVTYTAVGDATSVVVRYTQRGFS